MNMTHNAINISQFGSTNQNSIVIFLKIGDRLEEKFKNNTDNKTPFHKLREILKSNKICYFQKYNPSEKSSLHRVIIPLAAEVALELIVRLDEEKIDDFTQRHFYSVQKMKEIPFFNPPVKNTVVTNSVFRIIGYDENSGAAENDFKDLYKAVESGEIPPVEIFKEKDKKIWNSYVNALKKLVKEKEQIWKIKKVGKPFYEPKPGSDERAAYMEIFIDETQLMKNLEKNLLLLFDRDILEEYDVNEKRAFLEFKKYTVLDDDKVSRLRILGQELFYDLNEGGPVHMLSGSYDFKYTDFSDKEEVFDLITQEFSDSYGIDISINPDGYIQSPKEAQKHLGKFLADNFSNLLSLKNDNKVALKVSFLEDDKYDYKESAIKTKLNDQNLNEATLRIDKANKKLHVTVGAYVPPFFFKDYNLTFVEAIYRFNPNRNFNIEDFPNLSKVGSVYQYHNPSKIDIDLINQIAKEKYGNLSFFRLPTEYIFQYPENNTIELLRDFKTAVDIPHKAVVDIRSSVINIFAEDLEEYITQVRNISMAFPQAIIEQKAFAPKPKIEFRTDLEESREDIFNRITNILRRELQSDIEFQPIKNFTSLFVSKTFKTEEERDAFKKVMAAAADRFSDIVEFNLENNFGTTTYELTKNENLETENEKEITKDVRFQTFIFLNKEDKNRLQEGILTYGLDAKFTGGLELGKLIKKEKNKLKFKLSDEFEKKVNAKQEERLELPDIEDGFIKPIFPGELTNLDRMIRAMRKVTEPGGKSGFPVNRNLSNFLFDPNEVRASADNLAEIKKRISENLNEPLLKNQQKQLDAVAKTLAASDMALIQGPPGTGKTTVIAEIIWQVLSANPQAKILITSQTNLAVDNALERLKSKKLVRPIRIGKNEKFEDEGKVYSYDRISEWNQAKPANGEENYAKDNAVYQWIENVKINVSVDPKFSKAVNKWKKALEEKDSFIKNTFSDSYLKNINVFAATCSECGSNRFSDVFKKSFQRDNENAIYPEFDLVIMDEASKATPPELVLPLTFGKKVVIIGDHKQLPPMLDEKEFSEALESIGAQNMIENWTKKDYATSQFEKLFKNAPKNIVASLDTQFRMHAQIMNCISQFYEDQEELEHGLICGINQGMDDPDFNNKASRWHGLHLEPFIKPDNHAIWVNVDTPERKIVNSFQNEGEVDAVNEVIRAIVSAPGFDTYYKNCTREEDKEIGIITYYMSQLTAIKNSIYSSLDKNQFKNLEQFKRENQFQLPFRINTVDRFQGMERNIIIISTVRSHHRSVDTHQGTRIERNTNYPYALGFARELQRINVGFSRAKKLLIVVGNQKHFANKPEYAKAISKMHKVDISQLKNLA